MAIINSEKYYSLSKIDILKIEDLTNKNINLNITDIKIKTPDNPVQLKNAKLITFYR
jgi:hypothetical protein